jgi:tetratricopeptide (TPR) repeat protein
VKLLDGLPLAIELAAARARTLTPRALLARMSERFRLLASSGGRHDRQATLRAAFDWSWDLLSPAEKMTLAQLSVFESGFTLDAAEGVIDLSGMPGAPWALDLLNSLVDKSFVRPCGESRFDLLVSVQAYADEHLRSEGRYAGSGPAALQAAHLRHAVWFADRGPKDAVQHACADMDNLVVAVRRAVAAAHAPAAIGALEGAWAALNLRGPFSLAVELGEQVTKLPAVREGRSGRPHVVLAEAYRAMGQHAAATALYRTALERARASDDHRCQVVASLALGQQHSRQGLTEQALQELQHGLQWARQLQDVDLVAQALNFLGNSAFERGEMALAQTHYEAALDSARQAGDLRLQGSLLGNLGTLHGAQGRVDLARRHCEEALAINRQLGDLQREGERLSNLGMICHMQGEQDEALAHTRSALQVARSLGHSRLECVALANIGLIQQTLGLWPDAATHTTSALALSETHADAQLRHQILTQLAGIRGQQARDAWLKGEEAGFTAFRQAAGAAVSAMSVAPDAELQAQLRQLDADANRADASAQAAEGLPFVPPFAPA